MCHVTDRALLGHRQCLAPEHYWTNLIHDRNNNPTDNVDDLTNLSEGSLYNIFRCGSKRCQFQNKFINVNNTLSTTTNRLYVLFLLVHVNDYSSNVVYLINCNKCKLQHVGETSQNLNERFNWHNSCFREPYCIFLL